ncbi:MAG TPA: lysophospholipid acyltransferase family protein [Xanthobacteraceae bacterium]|nr:lysophospholipid acyltransferase family protein [Xanthobacteraceae bacterium]
MLAAHYLQLVWKTSRFTIDPPDAYEQVGAELPVIITLWHGQHFMAPFIRRPEHRVKALVSAHRDADINAIAAERLGTQTIRGSGAHRGEFLRKGGVSAFEAMRVALMEGWVVMLTADVPKIARVAGRGIVMLARSTGRPIFPVGLATSRRIELNNWDRSVINLPFARGAMVLGEAVRVPMDADEDVLESCRRQVETALNAATARAYAIVDNPRGYPERG